MFFISYATLETARWRISYTYSGRRLVMVLNHCSLRTHLLFLSITLLVTGLSSITAYAASDTVYTIDAHRGQTVNHVEFDSTGRFVISAGNDSTARMYDLSTGQEVLQVHSQFPQVRYAFLSQNKQRLLTIAVDKNNTRSEIVLWNVATGTPLDTSKVQYVPSDATVSPDRQSVIMLNKADAYLFAFDNLSWFGIENFNFAQASALTGIALTSDLQFNAVVRPAYHHPPSAPSVVFRGIEITMFSGIFGNVERRDTMMQHRYNDNFRLAYQPGSHLLAITHFTQEPNIHGVGLYDVDTRKVLRVIPDEQAHTLLFSQDGTRLITLGQHISFWDPTTGSLLDTIAEASSTAAYNRTGEFFATGGFDGVVTVRGPAFHDPRLPRILVLSTPAIDFGSVEVGRWVDTNLSIRNDSSGKMWLQHYARSLVNYVAHRRDWQLEITPGSTVTLPLRFYPTGNDNFYGQYIIYYERANRGLYDTVMLTGRGVSRPWFTRPSDTLHTAHLDPQDAINPTFSPDGRYLAGTGNNLGLPTTTLWDLDSGRMRFQFPLETFVRFSDDDSTMLTVSSPWDKVNVYLRRRSITTGEITQELYLGSEYTSIAATSDTGRLVVIPSNRNPAHIYRSSNWTPVDTLHGNTSDINLMELSKDGSLLVLSNDNASIEVWDTWTGDLLYQISGTNVTRLTYAIISPDATLIACGNYKQGPVDIYEARTGNKIRSVGTHSGRSAPGKFSHDSQRIVTFGDDTVAEVWDVTTGEHLFTLDGYRGEVAGAEFSPDDLRIVTRAENDPDIYVWDARNGALLARTSYDPPMYDRRYGIRSRYSPSEIAFTNDGTRLAIGTIWGDAGIFGPMIAMPYITTYVDRSTSAPGLQPEDTLYTIHLRNNGPVPMTLVPRLASTGPAIDFLDENTSIDIAPGGDAQLRMVYRYSRTDRKDEAAIQSASGTSATVGFFLGNRGPAANVVLGNGTGPSSVHMQSNGPTVPSSNLDIQVTEKEGDLVVLWQSKYTGAFHATLVDIRGAVVQDLHAQNDNSTVYHAQCSLTDLPSGTYVVVVNSDREIGSRMVVVTR